MNQAPLPKKPSPARVRTLNVHARNLASGNARRQQASIDRLTQMNLSPQELDYVHAKAQHYSPAGGFVGGDVIANARGGTGKGSGLGQALSHAGHVAYHATPIPSAVDALEHPGEFIGKDQGRIARNNRQQQKAFSSASEFLTGYKEIKNIRKDPLGGTLAIAGLLPFGKPARIFEEARAAETGVKAAKVAERGSKVSEFRAARQALKASRRGAVRSDEQAASHVLDASKKARQQGFGQIIPKLTELKPGEITPETGGKAGQVIRQGLNPDFKGLGKYEKVGAKMDNPGIGVLRKRQEEMRAVERSNRAGAVERASANKSGLSRHIAAKKALEGSLPAGSFKGFRELTPPLRDEAINHIYDHPNFHPYEKVRAADALDEAIQGKVPTESEQKLLERAFGKEKVSGLVSSLKSGKGIRDRITDILNVPRALMASMDVSAPFRQGLVVMASHPKLFFSEFAPMLKSLKSEDDFQGLMRSIHESPTFPLMEKGKLALTDIGETAKGASNLSKREEQFASNMAEQIPGVGHLVRGSDRAYVGFLNKTRSDLFNLLVHQAAGEGYHLNDKLVEDIAKFVNSATGRGDIGRFADHTATLNALFFSPRLLASRLNFLNPTYYLRMEPFARRQALRAALRLTGTLGVVLEAARTAGAEVNTDPRNADFGKIRIGNTRIDVAGGFQQPIRLLAQLGSGQIVSSTTGQLEHLSGGFVGRSRLDVLSQFAKGKLAPVPSFATDVLSGQQFSGNPLDFSINPADTNSEISSHYLPLLAQDIISLQQQTHSPLAAAGGGLLSAFGVGIQSYSPKKKKAKSSGDPYSGGGGSNSDPYGGGSSSSSDPYGG